MLNKVQIFNNYQNKRNQKSETGIPSISYGKFDKRSYKLGNQFGPSFTGIAGVDPHIIMTVVSTAVGAAGAVSIGLLVHTKAKLGKIINAAGEHVPSTLSERVSKIKRLALHDDLTGLLNKKVLFSTLSDEFKESVEHGLNYSVIMFDMDNFKLFNEMFDDAHAQGDKVIITVAKILQEVAKKNGVKVFRRGGDEFVVTALGRNPKVVKNMAEEMAEKIKENKFIQGLIPEFLKKANACLKIPELLASIFPRLRGEVEVSDYNKFGEEIINLIDEYIKKYTPADIKTFNEIVKKIKLAKTTNTLPQVLQINTKLNGDTSTLGKELDKIYLQYAKRTDELIKWIDHIKIHKKFTLSGAIANRQYLPDVDSGESLLKIADGILIELVKHGNSKNIIIEADQTISTQTIKRFNKNHKPVLLNTPLLEQP